MYISECSPLIPLGLILSVVVVVTVTVFRLEIGAWFRWYMQWKTVRSLAALTATTCLCLLIFGIKIVPCNRAANNLPSTSPLLASCGCDK
jgi:hypothetical protein